MLNPVKLLPYIFNLHDGNIDADDDEIELAFWLLLSIKLNPNYGVYSESSGAREVVVAATEFCTPVATTIKDKPKLSIPLTETQLRPIEDDDGDDDANQFCIQ